MTGMRIAIWGGSGAVVRSGELVVVLKEPVEPDLVAEVRELIDAKAADEAVRSLARLFVQRDLSGAAVAHLGETDTSVFAVGAIQVKTTEGSKQADAEIMGLSATFANSELRSIGVGGQDAPAPMWQSFEGGAAPGDGITFSLNVPADSSPKEPSPPEDAAPPKEPTPASPPPVAAQPEAPEPSASDFQVVSLTDPIDLSERVPLPADSDVDVVETDQGAIESQSVDDLPAYRQPAMVLGVLSPRGHFNHPDAKFCSRSGVKMGASQTKALVQGVRPPLGVLTFDDGSTYSIQWDTVVGREPELHELCVSDQAAPLPVTDADLEVSRLHLLLELRDWDLLVTDLETANGTFLRERADAEPRRISRGERAVLHSGSEVFMGGGRSFVYHEHHVR